MHGTGGRSRPRTREHEHVALSLSALSASDGVAVQPSARAHTRSRSIPAEPATGMRRVGCLLPAQPLSHKSCWPWPDTIGIGGTRRSSPCHGAHGSVPGGSTDIGAGANVSRTLPTLAQPKRAGGCLSATGLPWVRPSASRRLRRRNGRQRKYRRRAGSSVGQAPAPPGEGDAGPLLDAEAVLQLLDQLRILCKHPLEFGPRFR